MAIAFKETPVTGNKNTSRGIQYDMDGRGKVYVRAAASITQYEPYELDYNEYGRIANARGSAGTAMIGIAEETLSSGEYGWFIIEGETTVKGHTSETATAGNAMKIHTDGKPKTSGAAFAYNTDECGVYTQTTSSSATVQTVYMIPREVTWS